MTTARINGKVCRTHPKLCLRRVVSRKKRHVKKYYHDILLECGHSEKREVARGVSDSVNCETCRLAGLRTGDGV